MMVKMDSYVPIELPGYGQSAQLSRADARHRFDYLMAERGKRKQMLVSLAEANGVHVDSSDTGIQNLNDFYRLGLVEEPTKPGHPSAVWVSVGFDIALFLGDAAIERHPNLHWEFLTGSKKQIGYQGPVIVGYTQAKNPTYCYSIFRVVLGYGSQIAARGRESIVTVRGSELAIAPPPIRSDEFVFVLQGMGMFA